MTIRLSLLLVLPLLATPAAAQPGNQAPHTPAPPAAQPGQAVPAPPAPGREAATALPAHPGPARYGWQILVADGLALAGGLLLAEVSDLDGERGFGDRVGATWALGTFGSVIVHSANHRPLASLMGLSWRLVVPPMFSMFGMGGACLVTAIRDGCGGNGARWGFAAGVGMAVAVDAVGLPEHWLRGSQGWYGSSLLAVDAVGLGLGLYALGRSDDETRTGAVLDVGVSHYLVSFFAAPWVHGAHGHWGRVMGSFALRALTPGVLAGLGVAGYCAASGGSDGCSDQGAAFGLAIGSLLAATIDVAVLSWDEHRTTSRPGPPRVVPYIRPDARDGVEAGVLIDISPGL